MPDRSHSKTASRLFARMNAEGIRYCHWKSNSHLDAALTGSTDLDLLVDQGQVAEFRRVCAEEGFKLLPTHSSRAYPEADNIFSVDESTGTLLHLDVHYRLIIGQRHFKEYRPPWADEILARRVLADEYGVYTSDAESELLLLIVRLALKIRARDLPRILTRAGGPGGNQRVEFDWLMERTEPARVAELGKQLLSPDALDLLEQTMSDDLSYRSLLRLRGRLRRDLRSWQAGHRLAGTFRRWRREAWWAIGGLNRRYLHRPIPYSRGGSAGGLVVAVVGTQGAGKSTITGALNAWLAPKTDVLPIYFGSGDGPSSLVRWPLTVAKTMYLRRRGTSQTDAPPSRSPNPRGGVRALWGLALAWEKRSKLRRMVKGRSRGFIVICDRYPQSQVRGLNDGPLLTSWAQSGSSWRRRLAAWELGVYEDAARLGPDIFVRLLLTSEAALERRPGHDPVELEYRNDIVRQAYSSARRMVIDIDAEQELEPLVLDLKRRLWPEI